MTLTRHSIFGNTTRPTIYYFTGYGGTVKGYSPHIYSLVASGFRVVAFQYDTAVLRSGDSQTLIQALQEVEAVVVADQSGRVVAGVYGISLGSWFAPNIMRDLHLAKGVYNSAGAGVANAIWYRPSLQAEKQAFVQGGYNLEKLTKAWAPYDVSLPNANFTGKHLLVMNSVDDEVMNIHEARQTIAAWREQGNNVLFIEVHRLSHAWSIVRNMFRVRRVARFYAKPIL